MANLCSNNIRIMADEKDGVKELKALLKSMFGKLDYMNYKNSEIDEIKIMDNSLPIDPEADRANFYGTRYFILDYLDIDITDDGEYGNVELSGDSAWGPPGEWIEKIGAKYPLLRIVDKFDEPGMSFMGVAQSTEGNYKYQSIDY